MLFSSIKYASHNDISGERFQRALAWLAATDMSGIECGRHDIMGDEVFANVMEFTTVPAAEKNFEAHRRYADIHYVISGVERLAVAPVDEVEAVRVQREGWVTPQPSRWTRTASRARGSSTSPRFGASSCS